MSENQKSKKDKSQKYAVLSEKSWKYSKTATPEDLINDLRNLQKSNPESYISRNFYRENGRFSDATWSKHFGTFLEFRRQAGLEVSRQQHQLERQVAKQASVDHYREFYHTEVLPYHLKYEKDHKNDIVTMMVCSDLHDLEVDQFALSVFLDQAKLIQPDIIIFNGDIYDLYEFSKFEKDPRLCKPVERMKFVRDRIWKAIREVCPNTQIDFIIGNHEYRLLRLFADSNPYLKVVLSDFVGLKMSDIFGLDEFQINLQSKLDLACYNQKDITKQLDQNFKVYFDCFVANHKTSDRFAISGTNGHHHRGEVRSFTNLMNGVQNRCTWVQTPALHKIDAVYIDGLSQANMGFSVVHLSKGSKEVIQQLHFINQTWAHINGKIYRRK